MKNVVIILAGGVGNRVNAGLPKQFIKVAGKTIMEHTINAFQNHNLIDEIAIVINPNFEYKVNEIIGRNSFYKVKRVLRGGEERYSSTLSAIKAYESEKDCNMIFHDAVRPLVTDRIIEQVVKGLDSNDAVDVAILATDTIIEVDPIDDSIQSIPDRNVLRLGQTPQAFKLSVIKKAYDLALVDPDFKTTDDCGVVKKYLPDVKVLVVNGEAYNMKLTYKEDMFLLDKFFQLRSLDYSSNFLCEKDKDKLKNKVIVVFGGSYGIGAEVIRVGKKCGAKTYAFSRSHNGVDIRDVEAVRNSLKFVYAETGRIDYVVNSAAILQKEPLINMDYSDICNAIDINFKGMVNVSKESYQYLKLSLGHMLFYTSSSYTRGRMNYCIYSATKCAVVNFVQALAEEWDCFGIKVNCINPERTKTPMRVKNFGVEPEGTLLEPTDVAISSLKVLTSEVTGQVVDVKLN